MAAHAGVRVPGIMIAALGCQGVALIATEQAGIRFRDPDHVAGKYVVLVGFGVALMVLLDIAIRAGRRASSFRPSRRAMGAVRRERWTRR